MAPGWFPSSSLMCAGSLYMISGWLISHSFRPVYLSKFPSFLYWFVLGQLPSANVPQVRLACLCDRIVSDGSRSVAMGCCPAGSSLLASETSIAVDVRSVPLDGFAAGSSELVIGNFPAASIQSVYLYLFPISWHQLVASPLLSTGFQLTLDGFLTRSYQCVTCLFSTPY